MVRVVYTCPKTGVTIIGGTFSEYLLMKCFHSGAVVKCHACSQVHHVKVRDCRLYRVTPREFAAPLKAS